MNRMPRINNIKGTSNRFWVATDIFMLWLTILDLFWLMFDALYSTRTIQSIVDHLLPFDYSVIHEDFYFYDGIIVSIFIGEFLIKWAYSIYKKQYGKWFFYPFANWYDILGCFPTGSFRILRLFRIIGLTYRLHRWEVVDLNDYALFNTLVEYYEIIMEELSDRVVITVLRQAKKEAEKGQPLTATIAQEIIQPKKEALAKVIAQQIQTGIKEKYPTYQPTLHQHIDKVVQEKIRKNPAVQKIEKIPLVGTQTQQTLQTAVGEIVFGVINQLIVDLAADQNNAVLKEVVQSTLEVLLTKQAFNKNDLNQKILLEIIDLIIERVGIQKWRIEQKQASK